MIERTLLSIFSSNVLRWKGGLLLNTSPEKKKIPWIQSIVHSSSLQCSEALGFPLGTSYNPLVIIYTNFFSFCPPITICLSYFSHPSALSSVLFSPSNLSLRICFLILESFSLIYSWPFPNISFVVGSRHSNLIRPEHWSVGYRSDSQISLDFSLQHN